MIPMKIGKQLCVLVFILIIHLRTTAQTYLGVDAGITHNNLRFKPYNTNLTLTSGQGYMVNFNISQRLNNWVQLEAAPGLLEKKYTIQNINGIYQNINNSYLNLPLCVQLNLKATKSIQLTFSLGGYYAFWRKSTINGVSPNVFELRSDSEGVDFIRLEKIKLDYGFTEQDNRAEWGWVSKMGVACRASRRLHLLLKMHYYQSLTDQQKKISELHTPKYNETLAISTGFSYSLK